MDGTDKWNIEIRRFKVYEICYKKLVYIRIDPIIQIKIAK